MSYLACPGIDPAINKFASVEDLVLPESIVFDSLEAAQDKLEFTLASVFVLINRY